MDESVFKTPELSPDIVRSQRFATVEDGYDPQEVHEFLEQIASAVEVLLTEPGPAAVRGELGRVSESTSRIVLASQEAAERLTSQAADEARSIVNDAKQLADSIRSASSEERDKAQIHIERIRTLFTRDLRDLYDRVGATLYRLETTEVHEEENISESADAIAHSGEALGRGSEQASVPEPATPAPTIPEPPTPEPASSEPIVPEPEADDLAQAAEAVEANEDAAAQTPAADTPEAGDSPTETQATPETSEAAEAPTETPTETPEPDVAPPATQETAQDATPVAPQPPVEPSPDAPADAGAKEAATPAAPQPPEESAAMDSPLDETPPASAVTDAATSGEAADGDGLGGSSIWGEAPPAPAPDDASQEAPAETPTDATDQGGTDQGGTDDQAAASHAPQQPADAGEDTGADDERAEAVLDSMNKVLEAVEEQSSGRTSDVAPLPLQTTAELSIEQVQAGDVAAVQQFVLTAIEEGNTADSISHHLHTTFNISNAEPLVQQILAHQQQQ